VYEQNLKAGLVAAKELCLEARREAAAFIPKYLSSSFAETNCQPIFTTSEIAEIEERIERSSNSKEAKKLTLTLEDSTSMNSEGLKEILGKALESEKRGGTANQRVFPIPERKSISDDRNRTNYR
jgi:hypothetical protein